MRGLTQKSLENSALHYLQRFAATRASLKRVLLNKIRRAAGEDAAAATAAKLLIEPLLDRYVQAGLLNDTLYAEARTATLRRRGGSTRGISSKLAQKGVDAKTIKQTVTSDGNTELDAACELCRRKKLGGYRTRGETDAVSHRKDMAVLARAGFRYDVIVKALKSAP